MAGNDFELKTRNQTKANNSETYTINNSKQFNGQFVSKKGRLCTFTKIAIGRNVICDMTKTK